MEFNSEKIKVPRIILVIGFSLFFLFLIYFYIKSVNRLKRYEIIGIVQKVVYNEKEHPYLDVNGITYYLDGSWGFDKNIEVGDSIFKKQGTFVIKLIKKNTGEIIIYKLYKGKL